MAEQVEKALAFIKTKRVTSTFQLNDTEADAATTTTACANCCSNDADDDSGPSGSNSSSKPKGAKAKCQPSGTIVDANVVAVAEAVVNGELDAASCYHVSMKMSIDAATPRICGDNMPLKCDALAAMREALSSNKPLPLNAKQQQPQQLQQSSNNNNKNSPPPPPPCQLLERLNFPEGNIINTLHTILALPPFDPYAPAPKSEVIYKEVVSLMQWSLREDNVIEMELSDKLLHECKSIAKDSNDETRSYLVCRLNRQTRKSPLM